MTNPTTTRKKPGPKPEPKKRTLIQEKCPSTGWTLLKYSDTGEEYGSYTTKAKATAAIRAFESDI